MTSSPTSARRRPRIEYTLASAPSPLPFALDDLLPSDPADISYEDEGETYYDLGKVYANDFLVGEGRKDSRVNQQWVYDNIQIGQALLDFRDRAVENNFGISQPHEILVINFIFLLESPSQSGGLQSEVEDEVWDALWRAIGPLQVAEFATDIILEGHKWACHASSHSYDEFLEMLENTPPVSRLLKHALCGLSTSKELWTQDRVKEATFLKSILAPLVDASFQRISYTSSKWTTSLEETKDPAARLLVPDYSVTTTIGLQTCTVISLEGKTAYNNGYGQIWDDLTKLGQELKYALDAIIKLQPLQPVCVQGILVKGSELDFYHMEIVSEGIYVLRRYARCCLCTDANNLYPLVRILEIMQGVKEMTSSTVTSVRQMKLRPSKTPLVPLSWLRTSFHKPRRIEIH
ncbi:hypothetical protein BGZ54_010203 [Gamsiella multidivaricata]|nr:hypothetical protein BGZ54_010203 [Gamsiella multidivaricata]